MKKRFVYLPLPQLQFLFYNAYNMQTLKQTNVNGTEQLPVYINMQTQTPVYAGAPILSWCLLFHWLSLLSPLKTHTQTKQSLPPMLSGHQDGRGGVMWRGCVEPSGLRDWSSTFIFQGLGWNTRPAQVSRKTEREREKERGRQGWREGRKRQTGAEIEVVLKNKDINFHLLHIIFCVYIFLYFLCPHFQRYQTLNATFAAEYCKSMLYYNEWTGMQQMNRRMA